MRPPTTVTPSRYKRAFFERVRAARTLSGKTPADLAKELGVPKDTYHRYETRNLLPLHLIQPFCGITGTPVRWLVTGLPDDDSLPLGRTDSAPNSSPARAAQ